MKESIQKAFITTIPVMTGYLFIGTAFGIYVQSSGFSLLVALLMSGFIYAGSMQFASIPLLLAPFAPLQTLMLTLSINARHLFYGITMLKPYEKIKKHKQYMIFSLTDESYSLLIQHKDHPELMFWMLLLNQLYWIIGTALGYGFGQLIPFSTEGIEFSMAALFIVIFLDKIKDKRYLPLTIGFCCSLLCLILFGASYFIIPSMITILIFLSFEGGTV